MVIFHGELLNNQMVIVRLTQLSHLEWLQPHHLWLRFSKYSTVDFTRLVEDVEGSFELPNMPYVYQVS